MFLVKNKLDWKRIFVAAGVVLLLILGGIFWFDKPVFQLFQNLNCAVFRAFEHVFSFETWVIATVIGIVIALIVTRNEKRETRNEKRETRNESGLVSHIMNLVSRDSPYVFRLFLILGSVLSAGIITEVLKVVIGRMRPVFWLALGRTGFVPFTHNWGFNSMPSGHVAASFAGLVMIGLLFPKYKWVTWTIAIIVGVSRIAIGAHWPTDVIFAAFIGMLCADVIKSIVNRGIINK